MEIEDVGQAIGILIQGVKIAQSAGVYTLDNSRTLLNAIEFLVPPAEQKKTEANEDTPDEETKSG